LQKVATPASNDSFSVKIFSPSGYDRAFRTVERDNWNGKGVMAKRGVFHLAQKREEFTRPGVYIIYGNDLDTNTMHVYVGEGDPVLPRLQKHHKEKDFWTDLISFSATDNGLTKAHIKYLESRLVALAHVAKRCELGNETKPSLPTLSESDVAYADKFVENMLDCLTILNITFFHAAEVAPGVAKTTFEIKGKGAHAQGSQSQNGFTVVAGSTATKQLTNAFKAKPWGPNLRENLVKLGVLIDSGDVMTFTQDYEFDSPSAAAVIVYGNPMNGRTEWKTKSGKSLKEIQEAEVHSA
jgi:hypothetical protein